jgi:hypothetical protein
MRRPLSSPFLSGGGAGGWHGAALPDMAGALLVRLILDQFRVSAEAAGPPTLATLRAMLAGARPSARVAAFDLLLNLAAHCRGECGGDAATARACLAWLRSLLAECLLQLAAAGERAEGVWTAAASLLLALCCRGGRLVRAQVRDAAPLPALRAMLDAAQRFGWAPELRGALTRAAVCLLYDTATAPAHAADDAPPPTPRLAVQRITLLGGCAWLVRALGAAPDSATRRALVAPLLDLALLADPSAPPAFARRLACALSLAGGADVLAGAALAGAPGLAAALSDGLCGAWPAETSPGGPLELCGPAQPPPGALAHLEALFCAASALPQQLAPAAAAGVAVLAAGLKGGDRARGTSPSHSPSPATSPPPWPHSPPLPAECALLPHLLRAPSAAERRDGLAWLLLALREACAPDAQGEEEAPQGGAEEGLFAPATSLLPPSDSALGILLADAARPPPTGGPPHLRALVERLLLTAAGGGAASPCGAALATLEDAACRMARHGGAAGAACATEMLLGALALRDGEDEDEEEGCGASEQQYASQQTYCWGSYAAALLAGGCTVPLSLLRRVDVATLLALLAALSPSGGSASGGGEHAPPQPQQPPARVGTSARARGGGAADARAALVLLLLARCAGEEVDFEAAGGEAAVRTLAGDGDARVAYAAACFLLSRLARAAPGAYRAGLRRLVLRAQAEDDERLLENPHFRLSALSLF